MPNEFPHPAYLMLKAGLQSELIVLLFHQLASLSPDAAGQALHDFSTIADNIDDYLSNRAVKPRPLGRGYKV
ncbi:hypothetical protein [Pasteurella multocida]|uniref:hypothetical protein n=1 Tax=Pasteurella multocida TaxID=747 RepID=UPI001EE15CD2|nr:hypothetical protein [Pasteurella multocida]